MFASILFPQKAIEEKRQEEEEINNRIETRGRVNVLSYCELDNDEGKSNVNCFVSYW